MTRRKIIEGCGRHRRIWYNREASIPLAGSEPLHLGGLQFLPPFSRKLLQERGILTDATLIVTEPILTGVARGRIDIKDITQRR